MSEAEAKLRGGLATLGFSDKTLPGRLLEFAELILEANTATSLVGASSLDELIASHLLDSLAPLAGRSISGRVIDVGSGAGFPGIPIAIAFPSARVLMLEPREKRLRFLDQTIERLRLEGCEARKSTAETSGRSDLREFASHVTVRAVAGPTTALELAIPLLRRGGRALLYLGRQAQPTGHELEVAGVLGAALLEAKPIKVPYLQGVRHAWWFEKKKATPSEYPRRAKLPSKQPL